MDGQRGYSNEGGRGPRGGGGRLWEDDARGDYGGRSGGRGPGASRGGMRGRRGRGPEANIVSERETGVVHALKERYGFIRCCERPAQMFFHFSAVGDQAGDVRQGDEVEFDVSEDVSSKKLSAVRVRILPRGSVSFTEVLEGEARGLVVRSPDGDVLEAWAQTEEGAAAIAAAPPHVPLIAYSVVSGAGDGEGGGAEASATTDGAEQNDGDAAEADGEEGGEAAEKAASSDAAAAAEEAGGGDAGQSVVTECIRFSKGDMKCKRLGPGDHVSFQFGIDKRTRTKCAVTVELIKKAPEVRYTGIVCNLRPHMIECCDVNEDVPFHVSDVNVAPPDEEAQKAAKKWSRGGAPPARQHVNIAVGQEVEFSIERGRGGGRGGKAGERKAVRIDLLKRGTVKFHEVLPERMVGTVTVAAVEARPGSGEKPGEIERVIKFNEDTNMETVEILVYTMRDVNDRPFLVKPRVGDTVEFNVAVHKRTGKRTACRLRVTEKANEPTDVGKVVKSKGEFGFIRCLRHTGEVFYHNSDIEEPAPGAADGDDGDAATSGAGAKGKPSGGAARGGKASLAVGDEVRFVLARSEKGDPYAARISRMPEGSVVFERELAGLYYGAVHKAAGRGRHGMGVISMLRPAVESAEGAEDDTAPSESGTKSAASADDKAAEGETGEDESGAGEDAARGDGDGDGEGDGDGDGDGEDGDTDGESDTDVGDGKGKPEGEERAGRAPRAAKEKRPRAKQRQTPMYIDYSQSGIACRDELRIGDEVSFNILESMHDHSRTAIHVNRIVRFGQVVPSRNMGQKKIRVFRTEADRQAAEASLDATAELSLASSATAAPAAADEAATSGASVPVPEENGDGAAVPETASAGEAGAAAAKETAAGANEADAEATDGGKASAESKGTNEEDAAPACDPVEQLCEFVATAEVGSYTEIDVEASQAASVLQAARTLCYADGVRVAATAEEADGRATVKVELAARARPIDASELATLAAGGEPEVRYQRRSLPTVGGITDRSVQLRTDDIVRFVVRFKHNKLLCGDVAVVRRAPEVQRSPLKLSRSRNDEGPSIRPIRNPYGPDEKATGFSKERSHISPLQEKLRTVRAEEELAAAAEEQAVAEAADESQPDDAAPNGHGVVAEVVAEAGAEGDAGEEAKSDAAGEGEPASKACADGVAAEQESEEPPASA